MSGTNNNLNDVQAAIDAGRDAFSALHQRFGGVVPEVDAKCLTYYQEMLALAAKVEELIQSGVPGPQGPQGEPGPQGEQGPQGDPGPQGETGATGAQGETGATGPAGQNGADGVTPVINFTASVDNTTGIPSVSTSESGTAANKTVNVAFSHLKGETGAQGPAGTDGVSPTARVTQSGTNEITITVTDANGTTSATLTGEAGPQGPQGLKGDPGIQGPTGLTGPQGPAGADGAPGATGATGPAGPEGPAGADGADGVDGVTPVITITASQGGTPVTVTKTGTDAAPNFDLEFPGGGGASGYMTFGGKSELPYEPRLEERVDMTPSVFSYNVNMSNSVTYYLGGNSVNDSVTVNGTINLPADTVMQTVRNYFLGGYNAIDSVTDNAFIPLDVSDFTVTLASGNTLTVTSISITGIHSGFEMMGMGTLSVEGNVTDGNDSGYFVGTVSAGITSISGQSENHTYHLEPKAEVIP